MLASPQTDEGNRLTLPRKLDEIQLLALLRPRNMRRDERVHERLEIRPPPLRQRIADLPFFIDALAAKLRAHRRQPLVQPLLESFYFVILRLEVVARQLEECVRYLQHQDVRVVVLVADEDPFAGAPHAVHDIMFFEAFEARKHRRVFFRLGFFGAEGVVGKGVEADCLGLIVIKRLREERRIGGLQSGSRYSRHLACVVRWKD
jgi:hypothetical protein